MDLRIRYNLYYRMLRAGQLDVLALCDITHACPTHWQARMAARMSFNARLDGGPSETPFWKRQGLTWSTFTRKPHHRRNVMDWAKYFRPEGSRFNDVPF